VTTTITVRFPLNQLVWFDAMATIDTTLWRCRICGREGKTRTTPEAISEAIAHPWASTTAAWRPRTTATPPGQGSG
jgi:hypothetical protein